jgi:hypothetical protein
MGYRQWSDVPAAIVRTFRDIQSVATQLEEYPNWNFRNWKDTIDHEEGDRIWKYANSRPFSDKWPEKAIVWHTQIFGRRHGLDIHGVHPEDLADGHRLGDNLLQTAVVRQFPDLRQQIEFEYLPNAEKILQLWNDQLVVRDSKGRTYRFEDRIDIFNGEELPEPIYYYRCLQDRTRFRTRYVSDQVILQVCDQDLLLRDDAETETEDDLGIVREQGDVRSVVTERPASASTSYLYRNAQESQ